MVTLPEQTTSFEIIVLFPFIDSFVVPLTSVTMGLGKNEKRQNESVSCQLIPGGLAGTGPNGSFFESQAWVDQVRLCQASSFPQCLL